MRHLVRALAVVLALSLPVAAPVAASSAAVAAVTPVPAEVVASGLSSAKVVIVVGPVEGSTTSYRNTANSIYAEAIKWSSNVIRIYSPNATWAAVKPALQGASVVVYLGHGNGWPSPYTYDPKYTTKDGFGLNASAGAGDSNVKYYGEPSFANEIRFAPNAVVLLNHLCYASGNSEGGDPAPTLSVAMQRVDNFGQGFIKAGARAVIAYGHSGLNGIIADLFSTHQSILDLWRSQYDYNGNEFSFQSMRSPAYTDFMDPDSPSGGYYRSLVGNPDLRTEDITGVPYTRTDITPDTLQNPGAATVASGGTTLYSDPGLTNPSGSFSSGKVVRVSDLFGEPTSAAYVQGLTGGTSGWAPAANLDARDSVGPQLWASDGPKTVSPNGDGIADSLDLDLQFSESVAWSAEFRDSGWAKRWETSGTGETPTVAWNLNVGSTTIADGTYTLRITASDAWGNPQLSVDILIIVDHRVMPVRLAGSDRYSTAAAISAASYAPGVSVAYVASGAGFADALAGAPVAGMEGGPLLLVTSTSIPSAIAAELTRLHPGKIVVLGGVGSVSDDVMTELAAFTSGTVTRLAGSDRYSTAAAISAASYAPGVSVAYVASGAGFADALAGAPVAGMEGGPLLLVTSTSIPSAIAAELTRLHPGKIVVLGGVGSVSDDVMTELAAFTSGTVTRLAGSDRYSTAAAISAASYAPGVSVAYVASGAGFADALAGAPVAGMEGGPLLLVTSTSIPSAIAAELTRLHPGKIVVLGGVGSVSDGVNSLLASYTGS